MNDTVMSQTKCCSKCGEVKELGDFHKKKGCKCGVNSYCKACHKEVMRANYLKNKKYINKKNKENYLKNREYYIEKRQQWFENNKQKSIEYRRAYRAERVKKDPLFKLRRNLSSNIGLALANKGFSKSSRTHEILGCSYEELYEWLNTKANNNLTPYDDTHTDHVIPVSWGKTEEEVLALNHYSNLQLLSPEQNLAKSDSAPRPENYERLLANHPNPKLIKQIYESSN